MKILRKLAYCLPALAIIGLTGCDTDPEPLQIEHIGGENTKDDAKSEAYYASLRKWKEDARVNFRPISFGWFSNWNPEGPIRKGYMESIPDSVDMISNWSGNWNLTPAQVRDKEIFQKKKGGKILCCHIFCDIGGGLTPSWVSQKVEEENPDVDSKTLSLLKRHAQDAYWGFNWELPSGDRKAKGSEEHFAAIRRYAQVWVDSIVKYDYDGLDIDWEPTIDGNGMDHSMKGYYKDEDGKQQTFMSVFIKEIGKYFGPMATERPNGKYYYLAVDGQIDYAGDCAEYLDYYISQAYGNGSAWGLDSRVTTLKYWAGDKYDSRKHIFCENFESSWSSGGGLLYQASYQTPEGPKGGVGAFRFDNDYDNTPDYKYMRQAIQINLQSYQKWLEENNNPETPAE